jgi:hypothetical protein
VCRKRLSLRRFPRSTFPSTKLREPERADTISDGLSNLNGDRRPGSALIAPRRSPVRAPASSTYEKSPHRQISLGRQTAGLLHRNALEASEARGRRRGLSGHEVPPGWWLRRVLGLRFRFPRLLLRGLGLGLFGFGFGLFGRGFCFQGRRLLDRRSRGRCRLRGSGLWCGRRCTSSCWNGRLGKDDRACG